MSGVVGAQFHCLKRKGRPMGGGGLVENLPKKEKISNLLTEKKDIYVITSWNRGTVGVVLGSKNK